MPKVNTKMVQCVKIKNVKKINSMRKKNSQTHCWFPPSLIIWRFFSTKSLSNLWPNKKTCTFFWNPCNVFLSINQNHCLIEFWIQVPLFSLPSFFSTTELNLHVLWKFMKRKNRMRKLFQLLRVLLWKFLLGIEGLKHWEI